MTKQKQTYEMKKLVEARYRRNGFEVKIYRYTDGQTGIYVKEHGTKIFDIELEAFYNQINKNREFELLESTIQIKPRTLGNADEAYETTTFENGKVKDCQIGGLPK